MPTAPVPVDPPVDLAVQLARAVQAHQSGELGQAERLYRQVLAREPNEPDALHLLGVLAHQVGRHDVAVALIERAVRYQPAVADFYAHLGVVRQALGRTDAAREAYQQAVALDPGHLTALNNLGNVLHSLERDDEAAAVYRSALAIRDDIPDLHLNLSAVLQIQGALDEALAHADRAVALAPGSPSAHNNRGVILHALKRYAEAVESYRQVLALTPDDAGTLVNLGNALYALNRLAETLTVLQRAIALRPDDANPYATLSNALRDLHQLETAAEVCRRGLAVDPLNVDLHINLGNALYLLGRPEESLAALRQAVALRPGDGDLYATLGNALRDLGRLDDAAEASRTGLALDPTSAKMHSNLIFTLDLTPGATEDAWSERRRWNELHAAPLAAEVRSHANRPDPERRLRIGYVSADFRRHSAAYATLPILEAQDAERFEITCYSNATAADDVTARFRTAAYRWREVAALDDAELAAQIRADEIDILVDLSGHSAGNRLLAFARRPAPVQVSAWGYAAGTGLDAVDYLFADRICVPDQARRRYSERVIDLPSVLTYQPPSVTPDVAPLPALARGYVTFGSFNRPTKLSDAALRVWAQVLQAVPDARLLLKFAGLDGSEMRERILGVLTEAGVASARVELRGGTPQAEHLAAYGDVDVMLDPIPQGGGITTLEGLWMGVPVVTLLGDSIPSRGAGSILHAIGQPDLVASTPDAYVATAVRLAGDLPGLAARRGTLRGRLATSAVGDPRLYTAAVESAYRAMWRRWCTGRRGRA